MQPERTDADCCLINETWTSFIFRRFVEPMLDSRTQEAVITGFVCAPWRHYMFNITKTRGGLSEPTRTVYIIHHRGAAAGLPFMLRSFWNQQSSLLSCWHWQRDCYPCFGSWAVSLHHSGVVSKSNDMIGHVQHCSHGSAVFVMKGVATVWGLLISKSRTHRNAARRQCVTAALCVCVCVGALSRRSYQLLNHPSNYRGNRASITPSIIQGRQTERQNAARDVTAEWRDNKERGEREGGGGRRRGNEEKGDERRRILN